jgi:lipopolysaccharide transport system permease protein
LNGRASAGHLMNTPPITTQEPAILHSKTPLPIDGRTATVSGFDGEIVIERTSGWRMVDFGELYRYRDLLWFLTWRNIKVLYAQSAIGIGWAIIQPLFSTFVFTLVFGLFAKMQSDGAPYALFSLCALVPWSYFSNALLETGNCLVSQAEMVRKVYFPRLILPLASIFSKLVDLSIALVLLGFAMLWYRQVPTWGILAVPLLVAIMVLTAGGLGMIFSSLAIQFRDFKHAMNFVVQLLMYAAPVVYPASLVPSRYQTIFALNPMVGVLEGFRAAFLGSRPMPWNWIAIGGVISVLVFVLGLMQFRRQERVFADVA